MAKGLKTLSTRLQIERPRYPKISAVGVHAQHGRLAFATEKLSLLDLDGLRQHDTELPGHAQCLAWSADGTQLLVGIGKRLLGFGAHGESQWEVSFPTAPRKGPTATEQNLFFGGLAACADGWVASTNHPTPTLVRISSAGEIVWEQRLEGYYSHLMPGVAVSGKRVAVSCSSSGTNLYSIDGERVASLPDGGHLCGLFEQGRGLCVVTRGQAALVWWREQDGAWGRVAGARPDRKYRTDQFALRDSDGLALTSCGSRLRAYDANGKLVAERARAGRRMLHGLDFNGDLVGASSDGLLRVLSFDG